MWQVVRENPRAVIYAVLMHLILLALLMIGLDWSSSATKPAASLPIEATLVDSSQLQAVKDKKLAELRKAEQLKKQKAEAESKRKAEQLKKQKAATEKKRKAEQLKKQKAETEKKRKADQLKKQKAETEKKRKAEQLAKDKAAAALKAEQAAKKKAETARKVEQAAKEKAEAARKAEQLAKEKAEAERLKKQQAAQQREAELAMQAEIAAEQQAEQLRKQQARDQGIVAEYVGYITEKVQRNWIRPPGSSDDFSCEVQVALIPGGDVASARVVKSCGDAVLDRSVESAVVKAAPLPVPADSAMFHYFRELTFVFRP